MNERATVRDEWRKVSPPARLLLVAASLASPVFLVCITAGMYSAFLGWDGGVYLVSAGLSARFIGDVATVNFWLTDAADLVDLTRVERTVGVAGTALFILLVVGVNCAVLNWRPGAYLMVLGLTGALLCHLGLGVAAYRRVMARPWPVVQPLADDEGDW